jgi:CheY-like chemotaxis protein
MTPSPLKILAVDSEKLLLWALKRAGKSRELDVETASSPEQALAEIARCHFDLFLVAIDLRDHGSLDLLRHIDEKCPYVPIVIMTTSEVSSCQLNDAIKSVRKHGAWHLLEKPFRLERIVGFIDLIFEDSGRVKCSMHDLAHNYENEKRNFVRRPHVIPVGFTYKSIESGEEIKTFTSGVVTDISDCGIGLLTREPLKEEMVLRFGEAMVSQCGIVAWSTRLDEQTCRAGIRIC